ncbi:hypothetical protein ABID08_005783 [Rhizobium binae]|uniref:Uncharacterized protein n=1 Tax=Rhizobium binae TaxID=1138190 RepID=A0ABV2MPL5_9HYPH
MNGEDVTTLRSQAEVRAYRKRLQMIEQSRYIEYQTCLMKVFQLEPSLGYGKKSSLLRDP